MEEAIEQMKKAAANALATTSGTISATGLKQEVRIIRDQWGVPHIFAKSINIGMRQCYNSEDILWLI